MSLVDREVDALLQDASEMMGTPNEEVVANAVKEIDALFQASHDSFEAICAEIEGAVSQSALRVAFGRLDRVTRIFFEVASGDVHGKAIHGALSTFRLSAKLTSFMISTTDPREALLHYKRSVIQSLAAAVNRKQEQALVDEKLNDELFAQFFPKVKPVVEPTIAVKTRKREGLAVLEEAELSRIPRKKTRFLPVTDLQPITAGDGSGTSVKKNVLLTREKLRAGLTDPKGLLDLVDSSTNALEHTKWLELRKTSGMLSSFSNKSKSFADRLNAAKVRLGLGLGGHTTADSIVFGAKVLSCPGFLSNKNISDIENNVVDGKTTWKHQNNYGKVMIAGCLNQAKRILEMYDEILHGSSPEVSVQATHQKISALLRSEEGRALFCAPDGPAEPPAADSTIFVKKLIEAVAPIVPVTLRNKSLDGKYFRTALQLLTAGEILFTQYEADVRIQANPSGVVGMATALHADLENSCFYNTELKSLKEFTRDMKSQYQTSLGLGTPFKKDTYPATRSRRSAGNRGYYRGLRHQGLSTPQIPVTSAAGGDPRRPMQFRGRGECYAYNAGSCLRGAACRFLYINHN